MPAGTPTGHPHGTKRANPGRSGSYPNSPMDRPSGMTRPTPSSAVPSRTTSPSPLRPAPASPTPGAASAGNDSGRAGLTARAAFLALVALYALARLRNPEHWDLLDEVNLAVHEAGHLVFSPFGETLTILGGSLFQIIVPAAFVVYFVRTRQRYAAGVVLAWAGVSLLNVSRYIGDARAQDLPLLGGENTIHDWWYLLINRDLLSYDLTIARWVHFAGAVCFLAALVTGISALRGQAPKADRRM